MLAQSFFSDASLRGAAQLRLSLDPVRDTQAIFRTTLNAQAWPGCVHQLPVAAAGAPGNPWAVALLITLLDHETSLAVEPGDDMAAVAQFIRQRTGAPDASLDAADFILVDAAALDPELPGRVKNGTLAYPDESATLVVTVPALEPTAGALRLALAGPGVPTGTTLHVSGLPEAFFAARFEAVRQYPRGVDLLLVDAAGRIAALPRTTEVTIMGREA